MKHVVLGFLGIFFSVLFYQPVLAQTPLSEAVEMLDSVSDEEIANTIKSFSGFETRYHNSPEAVKAQEWLKSEWEEITQGRDDVRIDFFRHPEFSPMPSLILTIEGSLFPEEKIVLGAHADSAVKERAGINAEDDNLGKRSPGADDNASGIAVITEVLRVLMLHNYRPARTIMFMAYSAEEIGLKGSEHIATSFAEEGQNVIGVLNFDLTNFRGSEDLDLVMLSDYTSPRQNTFLEQIIQVYLPEISWEYDQCGRPCSDNASWHDAGFPVSMLIESRLREINPNLHKVTDTFEASGGNAKHSVTFVKVSLAFLVERNSFGLRNSSGL